MRIILSFILGVLFHVIGFASNPSSSMSFITTRPMFLPGGVSGSLQQYILSRLCCTGFYMGLWVVAK